MKYKGKSLLLAVAAILLSCGLVLLVRAASTSGPRVASTGESPEAASRFARLGPSGTMHAPAIGAAPAPAANIPFGPQVIAEVAHAATPALRDLPEAAPSAPLAWEERELGPIRPPHEVTPGWIDPVLQGVIEAAPGGPQAPITIGSFEGLSAGDSGCNCIPPDTVGAVGATQYVQMVNFGIMGVYRKSDGSRQVKVQLSQVFAALGASNACVAKGQGDPVVVYDQIADRWMISQFTKADTVNGNHECIGVSKTGDAAGAYWVYDFAVGAVGGLTKYFQDYPHFGLWPDAYYMATHQFTEPTQAWGGAGVFAFERDKMLVGQAARMVYFNLFNANNDFGGHLPASLDGTTLPPAGAPNYFVEVDDSSSLGDAQDSLRIWKFHMDWNNTANSTFGVNGQPNSKLTVANFAPTPCQLGRAGCVPQPAAETELDVLGDRLMFRLAYRNFGDHEALVLNHTVVADATGTQHAPRWYEVRSPGGAPTIFQQGTFGPVSGTDPLHRWMGSIAMDKKGDIGLAYSTSSNSDFPSIAYAGRLATDPPGVMAQGEKQMWAGGASENPFLFVGARVGRWGDYSNLTVDPVDDCTFWYTTEYFPTPVDANTVWHTRIGKFVFPECGVLVTPPTLAMGAGYTNPDTDASFTLNWSQPNGAVGPDLLQRSSTSCGAPSMSDDASALTNWTVTADDASLGPKWQTSSAKPQHQGNSAFWAQVQNEDGNVLAGKALFATLTYQNAISVPAAGTTTLRFSEWYFNENASTTDPVKYNGDAGIAQVSTNGGTSWQDVYTNTRPMGGIPDEGANAYALEDLIPSTVNLTPFAGQSIRLRFRFRQNSPDYTFFVRYGWYIDDISVVNDNWTDLLTTSTPSASLVNQPNGTQCYRVRTQYLVNNVLTASSFSNNVSANIARVNAPPVAALSATPSSGNSPLNVTLDGSASSDSDPGDRVVSYTFTFGDGSPSVMQAGPTISHTYNAIGSYIATLTAKDSAGANSATAATAAINVINRLPVAVLTPSVTSGDSPLAVSFDGAASHDADAGDSIVSYTFGFGDGSPPVAQPGATVSHTYTRRGTYNATLSVTDKHGGTSAPATLQIVVNPGPPVAQLAVSPSSAAKGDTVTLDASYSSGDDVASYTFDFGDGSPALTQPGATTSHVYKRGGAYPVTLSVRDTQDVVRSTTTTVTITNTPPVAAVTATPDPSRGYPPLTVSFDASGSYDPDSAKLPADDFVDSYEFDFGDGTVQTVSVPTINHTYDTPGTYDARLTVYDRESRRSSNQALWPNITVLDNAPVAMLGADRTSGFAPLTVVFDGVGSSDPDRGDAVVSYRFDFGDGTQPVTRVGGTSVQHIYANPGTYTATLVVQDRYGTASAPATLAIDVGTVNRAPIARAGADKLSGNVPLTVVFDASASADTDGDAITEYTFAFGDGSAAVTRKVADVGASAARTSHTFSGAGRYAAFVTVKDARGAVSSNSDEITITASTPLGDNTATQSLQGQGPFGGGMSPSGLAPLALLALLRRRRLPLAR